MTNPATGRPLRQLLGDELAPEVADAVRAHLLARALWDQDLDLLDQPIPTAETLGVLQAAEAAAGGAVTPTPDTHTPAARSWRRGHRS